MLQNNVDTVQGCFRINVVLVGVTLIYALVLVGGRSSRLDFISKSELIFLGRSLFERAVSVVSFARGAVVVGLRRPHQCPFTQLSLARIHPSAGRRQRRLLSASRHWP